MEILVSSLIGHGNGFSELETRGYVGGRLTSELAEKILVHIEGLEQYALDNAGNVFLDTTQATITNPVPVTTPDLRRSMCYFGELGTIPQAVDIINDIVKEVYRHPVLDKSKLRQEDAATSIMYSIPCGADTFALNGVRCQCEPPENKKKKSLGCVCVNQRTHTDYADYSSTLEGGIASIGILDTFYNDNNAGNRTPIDQLPLIVLVALQANTILGFLPNSHHQPIRIGKDGKEIYNSPAYLIFDAAEFVIFHPLLIHFGVQYKEVNLRVHVYMDSLACPRPHLDGLPVTYPIHIGSSDSARFLSANERRTANATIAREAAVAEKESKKRRTSAIMEQARQARAKRKQERNDKERDVYQAANTLLSLHGKES